MYFNQTSIISEDYYDDNNVVLIRPASLAKTTIGW